MVRRRELPLDRVNERFESFGRVADRLHFGQYGCDLIIGNVEIARLRAWRSDHQSMIRLHSRAVGPLYLPKTNDNRPGAVLESSSSLPNRFIHAFELISKLRFHWTAPEIGDPMAPHVEDGRNVKAPEKI